MRTRTRSTIQTLTWRVFRNILPALSFWLLPRVAFGADSATQGKQPKDIFSTMKNLIVNSGILPNTEDNPEKVIGTLITALLGFLGILFFILIIYGGFLWMTARGAEDQVNKAKKIITSASIGLAVVLSAYLITFIVLQLLTTQTQKPPP